MDYRPLTITLDVFRQHEDEFKRDLQPGLHRYREWLNKVANGEEVRVFSPKTNGRLQLNGAGMLEIIWDDPDYEVPWRGVD